MARRGRRGKESYYDLNLASLIDSLFTSAAALRARGISPFVSDENHKPQPSKVRELFGIDKAEMSDWRFGDWHKRSPAWAVEFVDRLIGAFSEHYEDQVSTHDRDRAQQVHEYWNRTRATDLAKVRQHLLEHRDRVEADVAKQANDGDVAASPHKVIHADARKSPSIVNDEEMSAFAFSPFPDLAPPKYQDGIPRIDEIARLNILANEHFGVVIEGLPKSGKRYVAHQFLQGKSSSTRVLWVDLTPESELHDILAMLSQVAPSIKPDANMTLATLPGWLKKTDTILVIAGIDASNVATFGQFLQTVSRLPKPMRVIITSSYKTGGPNTIKVGALSSDEAVAILDLVGADYEPDEIRALARDTSLTPFLLRQTAARVKKVDEEQLAMGAEEKRASILAQLPDQLAMIYEVLQILNVDLDDAVVEEVLAALGSRDTAGSVLSELERRMLLRRVAARTWRLEDVGSAPLARYLTVEQLKLILVRMAAYYRRRVERGGSIPRELSRQDHLNLFAACRLLQLADHDNRQRHWLRNRFAGPMEHLGAHKQLLPLYHYEVCASADPWDAFRYARTLFVVGQHGQALDQLDKLFHDLVAAGDDRDAELHVSVLRLLSEILIELGHSDLSARILDAAVEQVDVANLSYMVCASTVSVLSWALVKSGSPDDCVALNEQILGRNFAGLQSPFSIHVSAIRVGVAYRQLGEMTESIAKLTDASRFFAAEDVRAFVWSTANLALSLLEAGNHAAAQTAIQSTINVAGPYALANAELLDIYRRFVNAPGYENIQSSLKLEIERLEPLGREWGELALNIEKMRLIDHVLIDQGVDCSVPFDFQLTKYELLSFASPHAVGSRFNRTLVRRLSDGDLEAVLEGIFDRGEPQAIFRSHLYNRVIVEACRENAILVKKFVLPYITVIEAMPDSVLFLYARMFERSGDIDLTVRLLGAVKNKECFSFFNISANCAARSDPLKAIDLNDLALNAARRPQQRAQILHNKAQIVFDHNIRHRFVDAIQWCNKAIKAAEKPTFVWPRNLLLKLRLAQCSHGEVESVIRSHWNRFRMPTGKLIDVINEIPDNRLRRLAIQSVQDILNQDRI